MSHSSQPQTDRDPSIGGSDSTATQPYGNHTPQNSRIPQPGDPLDDDLENQHYSVAEVLAASDTEPSVVCGKPIKNNTSSESPGSGDRIADHPHHPPVTSGLPPTAPRRRRLDVDLSYESDTTSKGERCRLFFRNVGHCFCTLGLFLKLTWIDIKARTCSYCLGFFSVIVVVMLCVLMISLLTNAPVIFLRLSEANKGQFDLYVEPGAMMSEAVSLNYSEVVENFPYSDAEYGNHCPRLVLSSFKAHGMLYCSEMDVNNMWVYPNGTECDTAWECMESCEPTASLDSMTVIGYDADLERDMEFGTDFSLDPPQPGEVLLTRRAALLLGNARVGDTIILYSSSIASELRQPFLAIDNTTLRREVILPMTVAGIFSPDKKKFPEGDTLALVDYNSFVKTVANGLPPTWHDEDRSTVGSTNPDWCASRIYFTNSPDARLRMYRSSSYNTIRRNVMAWASPILTALNIFEVESRTPVLYGLYSTRMMSVFLGLIMSIILLALAFLSVVLIYTLLNVGVETKTYELGIQRMIGFTKEALAFLVLSNAYTFTIPAWLIGLALGQVAYIGIRALFIKLVEVRLPMGVTWASLGWATLAGYGIPLVAAFFPIMTLVTRSLPDALNVTRTGGAGIIYKIRTGRERRWSLPMLLLGALLFLFGFLIYYLFPTGLVKMDLTLIFYIFFFVLIGLLAGLVLLAMNFQRVLETCFAYVFFFWESNGVFRFMLKSLTAHRQRNRKSSLMYAMSLAFIIFITVAVQIQLISFKYSTMQSMGTEMMVTMQPPLNFSTLGPFEQLQLRPMQEDGLIGDFTYDYTTPTDMVASNFVISSSGRYASATASIAGLPPDYLDVMMDGFLLVHKLGDNARRYGLSGALYMREEGEGLLLSRGVTDAIGVSDLGDPSLMLSIPTFLTKMTRQLAKTAATLDTAPVLSMSKFTSGSGSAAASIPRSLYVTNSSYMSVMSGGIYVLRIRVPKEQHLDAVGDSITFALSSMFQVSATVTTVKEKNADMEEAGNLLNIFFIVAELMILIICFFSLLSSMTTNVLESSKEVGVLLCLGMTHFQLYRVFIWEAFLVVVASGVLGLLVGIIVAYTMQMQQVLFVQIELPFPFPWVQLLIVVAMGLVSAVVSSAAPVAYLLGLPSITHILRRTFH